MPIIQNSPTVVTGYLDKGGDVEQALNKLRTIEQGAEKNKISGISVNGADIRPDEDRKVNLENIAKTNEDNSFTGNIEISGNLTVKDKIIATTVENIETKENTITLRKGNEMPLANDEYAGIVAKKYDGTNTGVLVFDNSGTAYVGDEGNKQPLLTRDTETNMTNGDIIVWNKNTVRAETNSELTKKLEGIAAGAEVNVQSDFDQTDTTADDFIKNKPVMSEYERVENKITSITDESTEEQYPSGKAVNDFTYEKSVSDNRYMTQDKVIGASSVICKNTIKANAADWSITGTNVGDLNSETNRYEIPIVAVQSKNLFDVNKINTVFRTSGDDSKYTIVSAGTVKTTANLMMSSPKCGFPFYCKANTSYTISLNYLNSSVSLSNGAIKITKENYEVVFSKYSLGNGVRTSITFNSGDNTLLYIQFYNNYNGPYVSSPWYTTGVFSDIQLGEDSNPEYEPYQEPIRTIISLKNKLNGTMTMTSTDTDLLIQKGNHIEYYVDTTVKPNRFEITYYTNAKNEIIKNDEKYLYSTKINALTEKVTSNTVGYVKDWNLIGTNVGDLNSTTNKYDIPIVARGKNLITADSLSTFTKQSDGSYLSNTNISTDSKIYVDLPIAQYTLSYDIKSPTGKNYRLGIFFKDESYIEGWIRSSGEYEHKIQIIPAEKQIDYIVLYYSSKSNEVQFKNLQLEFGDTQTSYEPYITPITTTISLDRALSGTITKSSTNIDLPVLDSEYTTYSVNTITQPTSFEVEYYQKTKDKFDEISAAIIATGVGQAKENHTEIFNDYVNNKSNIPYSHIEGRNNINEVKCFIIQSYTTNTVTLDSVVGIEVGMPWNIFIKSSTTSTGWDKFRGNVQSISGNIVTLTTAENLQELTLSTTGSFFNTFIVAGGTIGSTVISDDEEYFYTHVEGEGGYSFLNSHAEGTGVKATGFNSHAEGYFTESSGERSHAEGYRTIASGNESHAEGESTKAAGKSSHAENVLTVSSGDYSHAEGRRTISSGRSSHAEGNTSNSTGENSHAEGLRSISTGLNSHAEGNDSKSIGENSHAEGHYSVADGESSHAEGRSTNAKGKYSHAENKNTHADGENSHAQGDNTTASGNASHAEGNSTIASGDYSHVQGKYNIKDENNKYADITGNGTSSTSRSNASTLDWDGNAWFKGNIKIGGTSQDDEEAKLILSEDDILYTNFKPVPKTIGGIVKGTTFDKMNIKEILDMLLYPYISPIITTNNSNNYYEIANANYTINTNISTTITKGSKNIEELKLIVTTGSNQSVISLSNNISTLNSYGTGESLTIGTPITITNPNGNESTNILCSIKDEGSQNAITKTIKTYTAIYPIYYGMIDNDQTISENVIKELNKTITPKENLKKSFTGTQQKAVFAFALTNNKDTLSAIIGPTGTNEIESFNITTIENVNINGHIINYKVYYLNTATTIQDYSYEFKF